MVSHHRTHPASTLNGSTCPYPQDVRSRDYLMRLLSDLDSQSHHDLPRSPLGRDGHERLSRGAVDLPGGPVSTATNTVTAYLSAILRASASAKGNGHEMSDPSAVALHRAPTVIGVLTDYQPPKKRCCDRS